ncbi:MAG TPA: orotidine-5'-phosphate decarboxylase [Verrucomicrobiae bacterium]|jgi:orotidine-5'-phosphate decarboxylase|nr:orotidine-5'-phosphate decarboxylase [Verrucomicrobiae bacterium]
MTPRNPIFVALDLPSADEARKLVRTLAPVVGGFKVGSELFTIAGPDIVREIRATGASVFLDLKFHDIPNTVAKAVAAAVRLDVQMLTVHAGGGKAMLEAAEKSAQTAAKTLGQTAPLVLAVTVLTSLDSNELSEVGLPANVGRQVERLAGLAVAAGVRGLVCSPLEIADLRQIIPRDMALVTPGIRAAGDKANDQKRTLTAAEAMAAGATWLVIGRPICAAPDPAAAARAISETLR